MPDRMSEYMNNALREAAGRGVQRLDQPAPAAAPAKLGGSDYQLRDREPLIAAEPEQWERWAYGRRVIRVIDAAGRLPGEPNYDPATTAPADPDRFNPEAAIAARRTRWHRYYGITEGARP